jgi:hypothetical protein
MPGRPSQLSGPGTLAPLACSRRIAVLGSLHLYRCTAGARIRSTRVREMEFGGRP